MAVTADNVRDLSLSGEFDTLSDPQIDARILLAESFVNRSVWDTSESGGRDLGDDGVAHLAAHFIVVDKRGSTGPAGPVTAEAAGGMSRSYAAPSLPSLTDAMLMRTTYGQRFVMLRRTLPLTPRAANESRAGLYNG